MSNGALKAKTALRRRPRPAITRKKEGFPTFQEDEEVLERKKARRAALRAAREEEAAAAAAAAATRSQQWASAFADAAEAQAPAQPKIQDAAAFQAVRPVCPPELPPGAGGSAMASSDPLQRVLWRHWPADIAARAVVFPPQVPPEESSPRSFVYWARGCLRARDNWALWSAGWLAHACGLPLLVLTTHTPQASQAMQDGTHPLLPALRAFHANCKRGGARHIPLQATPGKAGALVARVARAVAASATLTDAVGSPGGYQDLGALIGSLDTPLVVVDSCAPRPCQLPKALKAAALQEGAATAPDPGTAPFPRCMPSLSELTATMAAEVAVQPFAACQFFWSTAEATLPLAAEWARRLHFLPLPADRRPQLPDAQGMQQLVKGVAGDLAAAICGAGNIPTVCEPDAGATPDATTEPAAVMALRRVWLAASRAEQVGGSEGTWHRVALQRELSGGDMGMVLRSVQAGTLSPLHALQQLLRAQAAAQAAGSSVPAMHTRRLLRRFCVHSLLPIAVADAFIVACMGDSLPTQWEWHHALDTTLSAASSLPPPAHSSVQCLTQVARFLHPVLAGCLAQDSQGLVGTLHSVTAWQGGLISPVQILSIAFAQGVLKPSALPIGALKRHPRVRVPQARWADSSTATEGEGRDDQSKAEQFARLVYSSIA